MISCSSSIIFNDEVLLGWNVCVRDTDGHSVFINNVKSRCSKPVIIGKHVWLCSYSEILKGVMIGENSIVAWRSLVVKPISESNVLIAGSPATIKKRNVKWNL